MSIYINEYDSSACVEPPLKTQVTDELSGAFDVRTHFIKVRSDDPCMIGIGKDPKVEAAFHQVGQAYEGFAVSPGHRLVARLVPTSAMSTVDNMAALLEVLTNPSKARELLADLRDAAQRADDRAKNAADLLASLNKVQADVAAQQAALNKARGDFDADRASHAAKVKADTASLQQQIADHEARVKEWTDSTAKEQAESDKRSVVRETALTGRAHALDGWEGRLQDRDAKLTAREQAVQLAEERLEQRLGKLKELAV